MSVDVEQRVYLATNEIIEGLRLDFDCAEEARRVPTYHVVDHTTTVVKEGIRLIEKSKGLFDDNHLFALMLGLTAHDAVQKEHKNEQKEAGHPLFVNRRVRNQSGVAEDASLSVLLEMCQKYNIPEEIVDLACGIPAATTVAFVNDEVVHTRLLELGNPVVNFLAAKLDTAHGLVISSRLKKQAINTRFFLETYPDATAALINGTFDLGTDEEYEWVRSTFAHFSTTQQKDFSQGQFSHIYSDAEKCGLNDEQKEFIFMQLFPQRVLVDHHIALDAIAAKMLTSRNTLHAALRYAVQPIVDNRNDYGISNEARRQNVVS